VSRALILRQYGVHVSALAGATIGALLVAKVVLIADMLPAVNRFPEKPLIYNVVWKTLIYVVGALVVHYLEHLIPVWWRLGNVVAASRQVVEEVVWPHFWVIQLWLVVLLSSTAPVASSCVPSVGKRPWRCFSAFQRPSGQLPRAPARRADCAARVDGAAHRELMRSYVSGIVPSSANPQHTGSRKTPAGVTSP
jgi:hypothetical protein